jgi:hypothetical protein
LVGDFSDGPHDYSGYVTGHSVVCHLVRHGTAVDGVIVHGASVGNPGGEESAVSGAVDVEGTISLAEGTGATLRLRLADGALKGMWTKAGKTKGIEAQLGPSDPWITTFTRRALRCLADVACSADEANRLFVAADDAREPVEECFRFLDGAGPRRDPARGRACLERAVARDGACDPGSSADFDVAQLATLWIDGVGGPTCLSQARAILAGCFDDLTRQAVLAHLDAKESDAAAAPMMFCGEGDGTTFVANTCEANRSAAKLARSALLTKTVARSLDEEGKQLLAAANDASERYADTAGAFATQVYIEGTLRSMIGMERTQSVLDEREADLNEFTNFTAKDLSDADVQRAQRAAAVALANVATSTPEEKSALAATQTTWTAYRASEEALYEHTFGPTQGAARVRATILVHLDEQRARECDAPTIGGGQ